MTSPPNTCSKALGRFAPAAEAVADAFGFADGRLGPVVDLLVRLAVAQPFLMSGLVKLSSWTTTVLLYTNEHPVPGLEPETAARLGTAIEIICPLLLIAGLMTRLAALPLIATAVFLQVTYREVDAHLYWLVLLVWPVARGPGPISLDRAIAPQLAGSALPFAGTVLRLVKWIDNFAAPVYALGLRLWVAAVVAFIVRAQVEGWHGFVSAIGMPGRAPYYLAEAGAGLLIAVEAAVALMLALGLFTRLTALALLVPAGLMPLPGEQAGNMGFRLLLLAILVCRGSGPLALDLVASRLAARCFPSLSNTAEWLAAAPRVVIVGAGFGGIAAALGLRHAYARVTVIDQRNYHLFQPLLYQVATASLSPTDIATPIRKVLRDLPNCRVLMGRVSGIDTKRREILIGNTGRVGFDYLVLATGARHSYFGKDEWAPFAPGLKKIEDAVEIRARLLSAFEAAEASDDLATRKRHLTFVVVGGGPTGVELAGAIAELARHGMQGEFRSIDPASAKVILIQAGSRVLPAMSESLSSHARRSLERLGVEVLVESRVQLVDGSGVRVGNRLIETSNAIWAAGVMASEASRWIQVDKDEAGRIRVDTDLSLPGHERIFAIGDTAACPAPGGGIYPGLAPVAKQQGLYVARLIRNHIEGRALPGPFRYVDLGSMATIGRGAAVADLLGVRVSGGLAWWLWGIIHVALLVDVRNRLAVLLDWFWAYLTFNRRIRVITGTESG